MPDKQSINTVVADLAQRLNLPVPKVAADDDYSASGNNVVYFMRYWDRLKIGSSNDVNDRLINFRTIVPDIEMVGCIPCVGAGSGSTEKIIHSVLDKFRISTGGWKKYGCGADSFNSEVFRDHPRVLRFMAEIIELAGTYTTPAREPMKWIRPTRYGIEVVVSERMPRSDYRSRIISGERHKPFLQSAEGDPWFGEITSFSAGKQSVSVSEILREFIAKEEWRDQRATNRVARCLLGMGWVRYQQRLEEANERGRFVEWRYRRKNSLSAVA